MDGYNTLGSVWLIERDGEGAAITVWRLRMQIVMKMVVTLRIISRFTDAKIIIFRQMDATLLDFFLKKVEKSQNQPSEGRKSTQNNKKQRPLQQNFS